MDTALGHRLIERILGCDWFSILLIELAARPVNMDKPSRLDMLLGLKRSDLKLPRKPLAFFGRHRIDEWRPVPFKLGPG
jgi:hypothetical protein